MSGTHGNARRKNGTGISAARLLCGVSVGAIALIGLPTAASAQDRYWDANDTEVGRGGSGTWDETSPLWSDNADGTSGPYTPWNNGDDANFGGTAGTVTLGAPISAHNLTFEVHNYRINSSAPANTLTLVGAAPTITSHGNTIIDSIIAGSAGLTKDGAGALTLNGVNTFSGDVNINAGNLVVNTSAALGDAANLVNLGSARLTATGSLSGRTVNLTGDATLTSLVGAGVGDAHFTGSGGLTALNGVTLTDDTNDFAGQARFDVNGTAFFTSVGNVGEVSSLGTGSTNGTIYFRASAPTADNLQYLGDGDTSNRNWEVDYTGGTSAANLRNRGTGTLILTGDIAALGPSLAGLVFNADFADIELSGTISSGSDRIVTLRGFGVDRTISVLGAGNTYSGGTAISDVTVRASVLADTLVNSSLGTGAAVDSVISITNGALSYVGVGSSSNRTFTINNGTIRNDGTGALTLSGATGIANTFTLGGSYAGVNTFSGVLSGTGNLAMNGEAGNVWVLSGANSRTGTITVDGGTLRAGNASAFGTTTATVVNGGTLDLNGFDLVTPTLSGTGGSVALNGAAALTVNGGAVTSYAGSITGDGSLNKLGTGTLTLSGANTYTGATNIGGGTLALDFAGAGAPAANIIAPTSALNMAGGTLAVTGDADGSSQAFGGLTVTAGNNRIATTSDAGGLTVNLGGITRTGGLVDFGLPAIGNITTTNPEGFLGGWATVNNSDYAEVVGGNIVAFTAYDDKDDASTWLTGDVISDSANAADTPFFNTVTGSVQLGGLKYTAAANSTVTVAGGETLGVDGTIIVAPTVGTSNHFITGGNLTGGAGGGVLGVQQNGAGNFTIASTIVDNGGPVGFTKGGTGLVTLTGASTYTGPTILSSGILSVGTIGSGGEASNIGASGAAASNLVLENGTLRYTGATDTTDRGFTLVNGGPARNIAVTDAAANLTFTGLVTSPDDAGFTKTGAGTLTLAGAGNDYVGVTTVSAGTLAVSTLADGGLPSSIGASGSDSANLVLAGGTLQYTGATASSDRGFTLGGTGGGIGVSDPSSILTVSGTAVGTGGLRKEGDGTLVLSGTNTYIGGTTVNAGTLRAGSSTQLPTGGAFGATNALMTVNAGGTLDLAGFDNRVGGLAGDGAVTLGTATLSTGGLNAVFTGAISGAGGLTADGGLQTLNGCNSTYTGPTRIALGGQISTDCLIDGGVASGIGASASDPASLVFATGTLTYTGGSVSIDRGFTLESGFGAINVANAATTLEFGGPVVAAGGVLHKRGDGTLLLSSSTPNASSTAIQGGILRAGSTSAIGTGIMSLSNVAGALLDLNNFDTTVNRLDGGGAAGGNIDLGSATLTISAGGPGGGSGAVNYAGAISGSGGLIKDGGSLQPLASCDSSYTGSTTINGGVLRVTCLPNGGGNSSIGASGAAASNLVLNGGALRYIGDGDSTDREFTLGPAATSAFDASGTGALSFTSVAPITFTGTDTAQTLTLTGLNTGNNTLAAQITDNGAGVTQLTKAGSGTWILTNPTSTYTGVTTIVGGVLGVDKLSNGGVASSLGASSAAAANLVIGNGSTLRYTGTGDTTDRLFTLAAGVTFIESSGTGAVVFTDTGPVTLTGINQTRTIALGGTNTGNNTLAGSIGDAGTGATTLAKNDSGTWVLTGNNSFTGNTVINDGNLTIGDGGTTGNAGAGNVLVVNPTSTLSFNRADSFNFTGTISGPGSIAQIGTGTTVLTATNSIGAARIDDGTLQVDGALSTATFAMNGDGILTVNGTVEGATAGSPSTFTGDAGASTINVNAGAILRANGGLGGGSDVVGLAGTLDTGGAVLGLGGGDDTLTLNDGWSIAGAGVDAEAGTDTLQVNNAVARTLDGAFVGSFESLHKQNGGVLTLTGAHSYTAGTLISAGTLQIGDGGTSGTIAGDIVDNAALVFNRSDSLTVDGAISGTGTVDQIGTGITILTGANSYAGATTVSAGTLQINGDQSGATGLTTVDTGATLGGIGIVGGGVTVADGGTIAPGQSPGTLTINGDLLLSPASLLDFEFGQADIVGGPLNDLIEVGGDLVLDGTIDVTVTAGGSFDVGVYRVINYAGVLTDNGLELGTLPPNSDTLVQTSVANQVNLVNVGAFTFNFWDGAAGPKDDGVVNGGDGVWQNSSGNDNWTEATGGTNDPFSDAAFAIFQAAPGTVTVDNSLGAVTAAGMQFFVDGYVVTGDDLTLVGPQSTIIVGDGTAAGAGYTATIGSSLIGATQLVKTGLGTLELTAANGYTGGTAINGGTLRVSSDANLGDAAGGLSFDGGTLNTAASFATARDIALTGSGTFLTDAGTALTLNGTVSGAGALTKSGAGTLILTAANSYAGGTTIGAGTLQIGDGGTTGSIVGDVVNNGALAFNRSDTATFGGIVSGTGTLSQAGTGTTILVGDNSYTGGTTIGAGTLQIGDGGTTGSIVGDVVNNSALAFNRSDEVTLAGMISGTGSLDQIGTGTTVLTGTNSYAGATTVGAGTLLINGDQSAAAGSTSVASGATLGGTGIVGGDVAVADGATLAAGSNDVGTLTINGDLALGSAALLDFEFGQSNMVGGALNDLVEVGGDLILDGTIDVTVSPGGSFDIGVYRVINYGGTLTDNGLALGTMPAGSAVAVQTSVANQVNLVNAGAFTLNFWDGVAGPKDDGAVNGGDGVWQDGSGNDNWTESTGAVNAPYTDGAFAIFSAAAGTVTVDDSLGAVTASGMQFASDGYVITGDSVGLVGPQSVIRVGNGDPEGAGYTATIASSLSGASQLVKTDLGTLVLAGANSYTGGTAVNGGTLQISSDANLGDAAGDLSFDGGTLRTTTSFTSSRDMALAGAGTFLTDGGTTLTLNGSVTGAGALTKAGTGALVLVADNSYSGGTTISAGILQVGNGGTTGSIAGNVANEGALAFNRSDTLTFGGAIAGTGAVNQIGTGTTILTADSSYTGGTTIGAGILQLGSGGATGSIAGDVANEGALAFNRSDTVTFGGVVSGDGALNQIGAGTTILTGSNSYAGATTVGAGTLLINGDQSGATGLTSVNTGAALGGTGIVGGGVMVADGATLMPGVGAPGTLTINGDLSLSGGSTLAFEFGQANVAGGALNDLVNVGGDLVLDGTIDVSVPASGSFDVGVYRVFNYAGALTDNGLALGALPADSEVAVQTSITGQVNLVNSAGLTLDFWDGAAGPKNNGVIDGGDGTWQNSTGNDNWTEATGAVNAPYTDGAFAIFGGTGGTVTVDNSLGNVTAAGMQFTTNGYTVTGDDVTLTGPQSTIRVGDGSAAGSGFTATLNSVLGGATQLVKTDAGTLVLGGTNTYTGGTLITGGTVQISADANLGGASGDVTLDGGTLATAANLTSARDILVAGPGSIATASGTTFTLDGLLSGSGMLSKKGAGTLLLTGDSSAFAGSTQVEGTLAVNGSLCGDVNVLVSGRLQGTGTVCTTVNAGTVAPGNSIGTLTVAGDYTGAGGTLEIETELGGDASPTDRLVVTGNTFGSTAVTVINTGGLGAQTVEGIKIVDVGGTSAGTFTLNGDYTFEGSAAVIAGAYGYRLFQGGVATPADGDWYLRSALLDGSGEPVGPLYQPGVPLYESYTGTLQKLNGLSTLQQRVGNRQWSGFTQGGLGMWGRIEGARNRPDAVVSTSGSDVNTDTWGLQFGFDGALADGDAGVLIAGVSGRYGRADTHVSSLFGNGEIETSAVGIGATLTWYGSGGLYADAQAQLSWFDSDLASSVLGSLADDNNGSGEAFSLEVGQRLPLGPSLSLTPQAQIVYSSVRFDTFADPSDAAVSAQGGDSLRGRVGLSLDHEYSWQQENGGTAHNRLYGIVNLDYEMLDGARVDVSGTPLLQREHRLWGELGFGLSHTWDEARFTVFTEVSANTALGDFGKSNGLKGNAGFRMKF